MTRKIVLLTLAFVVLPGMAQRVRVDYDHGCNFSRYKTYRWETLQNVQSPDLGFPNQLMQERIASFVEEALAAKGVKQVQTGADLLAGYDMRITALPQFTTFGNTWGPGWGWDGWGGPGCCGWGSGWNSSFSTTTTQTIWTGTLVVNLVDAGRNRLVFQGESTDMISSKPEKNAKRFHKGICEMFERYPPRK
jgi:hypothetical protein